MIRLVLKIASALLLLALAIFAFIKLLPWCLAILAVVALAKFGHAWLCRHGFPPSAWWPWRKGDGPQGPAPAAQ